MLCACLKHLIDTCQWQTVEEVWPAPPEKWKKENLDTCNLECHLLWQMSLLLVGYFLKFRYSTCIWSIYQLALCESKQTRIVVPTSGFLDINWHSCKLLWAKHIKVVNSFQFFAINDCSLLWSCDTTSAPLTITSPQAISTKSGPANLIDFVTAFTTSSTALGESWTATEDLLAAALDFPVRGALRLSWIYLKWAKGMAGKRVRRREGGMEGGTMEEQRSAKRGAKRCWLLQNDSSPGRGRKEF